jgi:hypothetical protein
MPTGENNITKPVLEILHANRHTAGHYRCTADNRVGQPDSREIVVNVLCKWRGTCTWEYSLLSQDIDLFFSDPPEIEVERSLIHSGIGYEAILTCVVHAEPTPNVVWWVISFKFMYTITWSKIFFVIFRFKDTTQIGTTEQHSQQVRQSATLGQQLYKLYQQTPLISFSFFYDKTDLRHFSLKYLRAILRRKRKGRT